MTKKTPVIDRIKYALEDLPNRVTIGFEVETNIEGASEVDHDAMRSHAEEQIDCETVCNYAGVEYSRDWIQALGFCNDPSGLAEALSVDESDIVDSIVEDMDEDDWTTTSDTDWREEGSAVTAELPDGWDYGEDGSVSGPEFKSPVCEGRDKAISQAKLLFAEIGERGSLSIDTGCSCHIHIKMLDVWHTGHNALQQLLFEEVFNDLENLPECIKRRLRARISHIQPANDGDDTFKAKYNPIQRHSEFGTWEFRMFGNVDTIEEFTACLDVALGAMQRAYTRYIAGDFFTMDSYRWATCASQAMYNWEPIQKQDGYIGKSHNAPVELPTVPVEPVISAYDRCLRDRTLMQDLPGRGCNCPRHRSARLEAFEAAQTLEAPELEIVS